MKTKVRIKKKIKNTRISLKKLFEINEIKYEATINGRNKLINCIHSVAYDKVCDNNETLQSRQNVKEIATSGVLKKHISHKLCIKLYHTRNTLAEKNVELYRKISQ